MEARNDSFDFFSSHFEALMMSLSVSAGDGEVRASDMDMAGADAKAQAAAVVVILNCAQQARVMCNFLLLRVVVFLLEI